jgi:hypothetical protein
MRMVQAGIAPIIAAAFAILAGAGAGLAIAATVASIL